MSRNYVNLNVNPCKMCMPMGGVMAFKGIEKAMVILHGSQGCSTYIRRHMATHYNEPIDIASSSLTEQGTVYGGADNLKKGIMNVLSSYEPSVIGVQTTCLAETIGEDIERIILELREEKPELNNVKIVPVPTPGYEGTQAEGYYRALKSMVVNLTKKTKKNSKINIIAGNLNPGDIKALKEILEDFSVEYVLLPDVSDTLDAPFTTEFKRLPDGGTKIEDIEIMGGSIATIEMGATIEKAYSPGEYLKEEYGVPLYKCAIPIGLENTDIFFEILSSITKKPMPAKYKKQRGLLLDAMIDAHKYNSEARAIIYGEPELAYGITKLCLENGIKPISVATGSVNKKLKELIENIYFLNNLDERAIILDDTDFETIEQVALKEKANIMIGNSDGRRIEENHGIALVRVGFPIHDRIGAQRKCITGYKGTMDLIEETANVMLSKKETSFREEMYNKYYKKAEKVGDRTCETRKISAKFGDRLDKKLSNIGGAVEMDMEIENKDILKKSIELETIKEKTEKHPCYNQGAHDYARMHLPIAPKCNVSCNYCSRKYDCPNESRPGVTSEVLNPEQALEKFKLVKSKMPNLKVIGIAGPGDALANFDETRKAIELIKAEDPTITFCLSTNGLMLPFYAEEIIRLGISHVTITINTVDPEIGAKIYKNVNYLGRKLSGVEGATIILQNQLSGLQYLASKGIICKVNIVMVKGVNAEHIPDVVKKVKEMGAYITNIMQMIPAPGSVFENQPLTSKLELDKMRKTCEVDMKQMYHCKQCRADAIGTLEQDRSIEFRCSGGGCSSESKDKVVSIGDFSNKTSKTPKYRFAIASSTGINVDQHFGQVSEFYIYDEIDGNITFIEKRNVEKYCNGKTCVENNEYLDESVKEDKTSKLDKIYKSVEDCQAVLTLRAGEKPVQELSKKGIKVFQMYDGIHKAIKAAKENLLAS
ncbi:nitrogenase cofactor biosynthesis protein NifB [Clostridium grantii]|uniref:FeMo cofactor biosynthesis protein NifB n=1 Tax=Clostridium grantii DSM 8605 TaxID=1121316 RepID=A0A1M5UX06_9CLOT|nr:nitrogenase cofactor biosynthesis protein NifB [Clostridium grantii]SHH67502.1 nitrogenase cofactor biosynthesis protein NifB [Clostridium grantii DSM 8605]